MTAHTTPPETPDFIPQRPRLVFRVGFAGTQKVKDDERENLASGLRQVLDTVGHELAAITGSVRPEDAEKPPVASYYASDCPMLRLVTGLCEGADLIAGEVIEQVDLEPCVESEHSATIQCLETELAAVLPFSVEAYRGSRPEQHLAEFDRQLSRCAWVLELDGIYEKPPGDSPRAKKRRGRGYRAQGAFLVRQSDMLIAAGNPDDEGRAGGTRETVREALAFGLPVAYIHLGTGEVYLVSPEEDLPSVLAEPRPETPEQVAQARKARDGELRQWVRQLTADPDSKLDPGESSASEKENRTLRGGLVEAVF